LLIDWIQGGQRASYGRITLGRNMASLEAYNGAGKIHTMGRNLPVKFIELPVNILTPKLPSSIEEVSDVLNFLKPINRFHVF